MSKGRHDIKITDTERATPKNNTSGNVYRTDRVIIYGNSFHSGLQLVSIPVRYPLHG